MPGEVVEIKATYKDTEKLEDPNNPEEPKDPESISLTYHIMQRTNSTWHKNSAGGLDFKADGECSASFKVRQIDSAKVEDTKDDINDTKSVSDNNEETQSKDTTKRNELAPVTGDSSEVVFWSILAVSAICMVMITLFKNRK